jgi:hypothetical protein
MKLLNAMICIVCFRKLRGPDVQPVTFEAPELRAGERWTPCGLCRGPCDAVPGIFYRLWADEPQPLPAVAGKDEDDGRTQSRDVARKPRRRS